MGEHRVSEVRLQHLFFALVLLVVVSPLVERLVPELRLNLFLRLAVLVGAVRAMPHQTRGRWALALLAAAASLGAVFPDFAPGWLPAASLSCELLFYSTMIALLRHEVFQRPRVSSETLFGAAAIYVFIALVFGAAYQLVALTSAESFRVPEWAATASAERVFYYFSFATLTTLGFGDITPASEVARSLVVLESFTGVLFASIVISRLVALHVDRNPEVPFDPPAWQRAVKGQRSRFEILLVALLIQIAAYPHVPMAVTRMVGVGILLAALHSLRLSRARLGVGLAFAVPAALGWGWWSPGSVWMVVGQLFLTIFLVYAAAVFAAWIFRQREVGREVITGICCVYLLIGAAFASAHGVVSALDPSSLSGVAGASPEALLGAHIYLSFVTLTTLGYGDIVPASAAALSLTTMESVIGVLFPAVVVAELVSVYHARAGDERGDFVTPTHDAEVAASAVGEEEAVWET